MLPNVHSAKRNTNAVLFQNKDNETAEQIKAKVEELMRSTSAAGSGGNISAADEILKFKNLMEQGIITPEEFERKKAELL